MGKPGTSQHWLHTVPITIGSWTQDSFSYENSSCANILDHHHSNKICKFLS